MAGTHSAPWSAVQHLLVALYTPAAHTICPAATGPPHPGVMTWFGLPSGPMTPQPVTDGEGTVTVTPVPLRYVATEAEDEDMVS